MSSFGWLTWPTSAPFRVGYHPIWRVMDSPCLSAASLRFLGHPLPSGEFRRRCRRPTGVSTTAGLHRGYHVARVRDAAGVGAAFTPGLGCPYQLSWGEPVRSTRDADVCSTCP